MSVWCERLIVGSLIRERVRVSTGPDGRVTRLEEQTEPHPGDITLGTAIPGIADAHSHAFHRVLRGRTHHDGGDFWLWREQMYSAAASLDPASYFELARAVFAEMLVAGFTAVGEFHYVHHRPNGSVYPHEMELAIARAADEVGIRLVVLDTAYLAGGIGRPLSAEQQRFSDGSGEGYLQRWYALREHLPSLGAALHSVRAVPLEAISEIIAGLPAEVPLHVHLSEQRQENADAVAAFGRTPTRLLHDLGVLSPRMSVVHATHLSEEDIDLLGAARVSVVMCPTTEADLGDGIGPARALLDRGARLALGSDQNAVVDPLLEIRGLEMQERLSSGRRGRFTLDELGSAAGRDGYRSLGLAEPLVLGGPCDLVEIATDSVRTVGSAPAQLPLAATASDVRCVVVGGRVVAESGVLADGREPALLLASALTGMRRS
jgi:formiminoglutamate deiminase